MPGLVVLFGGLAACGSGDGEPVADPLPDHREAERVVEGGETIVLNEGPREALRVRDQLPSGSAQLIFLRGRAATPTPSGGAAWADLDGGRVLVFGHSPVGVQQVIQSGDGEGALEPVVAQVRPERTRIFQRDGTGLAVAPGGELVREGHRLPGIVTGADPTFLATSRSPLFLPLSPVRAEDPLLWIAEDPSSPPRPMGRVLVPEEPVLGYLVNSGWALPAPDGGAYFASGLRPELIRIGPDGHPEWTSRWRPRKPVREPRIEAVDGSAVASFDILQHAAALGGDGRIYVLTASESTSRADRLLVFEPDGTLVRTGKVPPDHAVFLDDRGAVHAIPEDRALMDPAERDRAPFDPFDLPDLIADNHVNLEEYEDRVVVVNFWASWCPPCRREIPALDSLAAELDPHQAVVIGLNDDQVASRGVAFLNELGGVSYPNARGGGRLRGIYGYRGLPYTVILDRDHKVIQSFYGFGGSVDPLRRVVREELARYR